LQLGLRWGRAALLAAAALFAAGCALSEYENRMIQEQERIDYLDEEARYLDAPVKLPVPKDAKKDEATRIVQSVFFRPPRGFTKLDPQQPPGAVLNTYLPGRSNAPFKDVELAVARGKKTEEEFRKEVLLAFGGTPPALERKKVEHKASHRETTYQSCRVEDPQKGTTAYIYFTKQGEDQAAVVFKVEGTPQSTATKMMEFSLASLALGRAARDQWNAFKGSVPDKSSGGRK
jgi:hypothetical protein